MHLRSRSDGDNWQLQYAVRDTGTGIPKEKQSSIFEKFHQADSSTTRKYGGTGLGLAISRWLVKQMGGDLTLQSAVDQGSTFEFTMEPSETTARAQPALSFPPPRNPTSAHPGG